MFANLRYLLFPVLQPTGAVFVVFAAIMQLPVLVSLTDNDGMAAGFETGAVVSLLVGAALIILTRPFNRELMSRDGFLLAGIIWSIIPIFAAIPFYLNIEGIDFTHAYFEAISGTTTTCATVLTGLDKLPDSINFWRCLLSWLGGMGILVLAVAVLPLLGVGGAQIFKAEASGPMKESRLTPRIADTAKGLWWIYVALTLTCTFAYSAAGMDSFDALIHAFSTVSLGGFSSHDASFAFWNSDAIETVAILFMLICGASFSLHFVAWRSRSLMPYLKSTEFLSWFIVCLATVIFVTVYLTQNNTYESWGVSLRHAAFNVISVVSTTGFSSTDYNLWPIAAPMLMILCSCFASCGGSTGGGIKMLRAMILLRQTLREFLFLLHPKAVSPMLINGNVIPSHVIFQTFAYMQLWIGVSVIAALAMMMAGADLVTAASATLACITNTGPGLAEVGPASTFAGMGDFELWLCSFCMLIGRLEIMTVLVIFTRSFWRP